MNATPFAARNTKLDAISTARRTTAKVRGGAVGAPTNRSKKGFKERAIRFVFTLQPPLRRGGLALRNYGAQLNELTIARTNRQIALPNRAALSIDHAGVQRSGVAAIASAPSAVLDPLRWGKRAHHSLDVSAVHLVRVSQLGLRRSFAALPRPLSAQPMENTPS